MSGRLDERKGPKFEMGRDPSSTFYLAVTIGNTDGSLDEGEFEVGCVEGLYDDEASAVRTLREVNEEYPTIDGYVYRCVPVARIWRGKVRVTKLAAKASSPLPTALKGEES